MWNRCLIGCLLIVGLTACMPRAVREAQTVVAEADSLRAEGQMYDDSVQLAEAYEALDRWQWFYADDYAHACYHYGRLLREKGDPVAAMQVLIRATHSRTHDYHILGRVYSNMGSICHLANDYSLSYDMYQRSADMFLSNGDSQNYYYALNDMAYELAEQGKEKETLLLLDSLTQHCLDTNVTAKTLESKAKLHMVIGQYDSVLISLDACPKVYSAGYSIKARALWHLNRQDSALYYARKVLAMPSATLQEQYNMLYIILNEDSTLQPEEIKSFSAQRADIEHKMLVPLHKRYAVAVKLLRQDIEKVPVLVYAVPVTSFICIAIFLLVLYARKIHKGKLQQQEILQTVREEQTSHFQHKLQTIEQSCAAIRCALNWQTEINWKDYDGLCEFMDKNFFFFAHKLNEKQVLNEKEIRLCILVLINRFTDNQMADILCYGQNSIRGIKRHTAQKLGTTSANLRAFLLNLIADAPRK